MSTPAPRTIDAWVKLLGTLRLPVEESQHLRLRQLLGDNQRSWRDIAERVELCPSFALAVMRTANKDAAEPAESIEAALTRLGAQRSEQLLASLPALPKTKMPAALLDIQLVSEHASQQARGLFGARLARVRGEISGCSLLFLSPLWVLLQQHPEFLDVWRQRVLLKKHSSASVERELLGVSLLSLCRALAEHWGLPQWITSGYRLLQRDRRLLAHALYVARNNDHPLAQQQMLDSNVGLRHWLTHPNNCVLLANALAVSTQFAWGSRQMLRWLQLTGLYVQLPVIEVIQQVHQQAVISARQGLAVGRWHPAHALLWPWHTPHYLQQVTASVVGRAAPPSSVEQWRGLCKQLLAEPSPFSNSLQLTACARDALLAAGMQRVLILVADHQRSLLQVRQAAGLDETAQHLSFVPSASKVLHKLMAGPGQLRLNPENIAQFSALIPGTLKAVFSSEHVLLRSLASNGHVAMLVVADQQGMAFSDLTLQTFGKTAQCIERAIGYFARRGR